MMIDETEEQIDILEKASDDGAYKPIRPLPLPPRKKKKKKKKLFPTDPEDPETDEDFDEEEDDDDDDSESGSDTDTEPDSEDENELKQEEQKPQSFFKNPFFLFKRHENMALKKGPHPEKQQRSPVMKFIDVLLYGVEGARIKNGELPKQNIADELLLGLGFKAYLKDVLLGRQAAKYWQQKMKGKDNVSLLKVGLKGLKKQAVNDPAARVMIKEVERDLNSKSLLQQKQQNELASQLQMQKNILSHDPKINPKEVMVTRSSDNEQRQSGTMPDKKMVLTEKEMQQILLKAKEEEQRILNSEKQNAFQKASIEEKMVLMERRLNENKILQQAETHKNIETQSLKNSREQNDKAQQLLMQKNELQAQQNQQAIDSAAVQHAARLAAVQMGSIVRAGVEKTMDRNGVMDVVQRGMNPIDRQISGLVNGDRNIPSPPRSEVAPPMPTSSSTKETPASERTQPRETPESKPQPLARQEDDKPRSAARTIAESSVAITVDTGSQQNTQPQQISGRGEN